MTILDMVLLSWQKKTECKDHRTYSATKIYSWKADFNNRHGGCIQSGIGFNIMKNKRARLILVEPY